MKRAALVIFVKTPGFSSIKTRLAVAIDISFAEAFYLRSLQATKDVVLETVRRNPEIIPYWAVAEENGLNHPLWYDFNRISQGGGGLGERLSHAYDKLQKCHDFVIFIGADSPLITPKHLEQAYELLVHSSIRSQNIFVLGPAQDGGFYLFGSGVKIPSGMWTSIQYSQSDTIIQLKEHLRPLGLIQELNELSDVDTLDDLFSLLDTPVCQKNMLEAQKTLLGWIQKYKKQLHSQGVNSQ